MKELFKIFTFVFALSFIAGLNVSAQDAPSIGPAPYVYNNVEQSVVFDNPLPTSRAFTYNATSISASQLKKYFLGTPGTSSNVGTVQTNFMGCGDFGGPNMDFYVIQQVSPYSLFTIDTTTGAKLTTKSITGILSSHSAGGITGCAWDATTNTMFITSTAVTSSQLYTLNLTTGAATQVGGLITNAPGIIAIAINTSGSLFAIDIVNDKLWRLNKTTGVATEVGALTVNANYGQDADFDPRDDVLYWASYTTSANLRTVDTTSGAATLVGPFTGFSQALATGIPAPAGPPPATFHYNALTGSGNTFPLGQTNGKFVNWLFPPNVFVNPTPCPPNTQIDTIHIRMYGTGSRTYTNLHILMAQTTLTNLTSGQFYAGPWDTVYYQASQSLTSPGANMWMPIALQTPYAYDPTKALVVGIGQCGGSGSGMYVLQTTLSGTKRTWSVGGCPFVPYSSGDGRNLCMGISVTPISGITQISTITPDQFSLSQNYPNPFNPTTTIEFKVPTSGLVILKVYDVLGKEVNTLVNEVVNAGEYSVDFNASNLPSGTYFYRLQANDFVSVKKMMLIK